MNFQLQVTIDGKGVNVGREKLRELLGLNEKPKPKPRKKKVEKKEGE